MVKSGEQPYSISRRERQQNRYRAELTLQEYELRNDIFHHAARIGFAFKQRTGWPALARK